MLNDINKVHKTFTYITVEQATKIENEKRSIKELTRNARNESKCIFCKLNPVWRYAGTDMCFTCTTGETDASNDYELMLIR